MIFSKFFSSFTPTFNIDIEGCHHFTYVFSFLTDNETMQIVRYRNFYGYRHQSNQRSFGSFTLVFTTYIWMFDSWYKEIVKLHSI